MFYGKSKIGYLGIKSSSVILDKSFHLPVGQAKVERNFERWIICFLTSFFIFIVLVESTKKHGI